MKAHYSVFIIVLITSLFSACKIAKHTDSVHYYQAFHKNNIKAGYCYYYNNTDDINYFTQLGLNTVILKVWEVHDASKWIRSLRKIREWSQICAENKVDLYIMVNLHPYPYMKVLNLKYAETITNEKSDAVDVIQEELWIKHINYMLLSLTDFITSNDLRVNGLIIDTEVYSDTKSKQYKRSFESKDILINVQNQKLLFDGLEKSKAIPIQTSFSDTLYLEQLRREYVKNKFANIFSTIRKRLPAISFGMYPHPVESNFVQFSLAQTIGTIDNPGIILSIESYGYKQSRDGSTHAFISSINDRGYKQRNIHAKYIAGYLLRKLTGKEIAESIQKSADKVDGFWLYRIPDFSKKAAKSNFTEYQKHLIEK